MISRAKAREWAISYDPLGVVTITRATPREDDRPATRRIRVEPVAAPHSVTRTQFDDLSIPPTSAAARGSTTQRRA